MSGVKGKSGGSRFITHPKSKLSDPVIQQEWQRELQRAITSATSNWFILRKNSFWTTRDIQKKFGLRAVEEFKSWFEAERLFDQVEGDRLYQQLMNGTIDEKTYKKFKHTVAMSWCWSVRPEKREAAWAKSRGIT